MTTWTETHDIVPESRQELFVPEPPAPEFPWYLGCTLTIDAEGMIGSGVVCTGLTPPGGWSEANLDDGATDWPYHGSTKPNAHPYALIGSLDGGGTWFYIGRSRLLFSDVVRGPGAPTPTARLRLAVNRPRPDETAAGDHSWTVTVTFAEPDPIHPQAVCAPAQGRLDDLRNAQAPAACSVEQQAERNLSDRVQQVLDAGYVVGALAVGLSGVAVAVLAADAAREAAAQQAAASALGNEIASYTSGTSGAGAAHPATWDVHIGPAIAGEVTVDAVLAGAMGVRMVAQAYASPLMAVWWIALVIVALSIALVAAIAVLLVLLLSLLTLAAEVDNARSDFEAVVSGVQSILAFMHRIGCPGVDDALPACP